MIESFAAYVPLAVRTESRAQDGWRADIPVELYRVNHALTGLMTETGELLEAFDEDDDLDWVNVHEEIGDLWWYAAILADTLVEDFEPELDDEPCKKQDEDEVLADASGQLAMLVVLVARGLDVVKRRLYYGAGDDAPKAAWDLVPVEAIIALLDQLTTTLRGNRSAIWGTNIAKLAARYPDAFSSEAALIRDLEAERAILER